MKRRGDPRRKHIGVIIVGVSPVVKMGSKSSLPLLSLYDALSIGRVENKTLELQFSDSTDSGPYLESQISISFIGVGEFDESHVGVEVRADFSAFKLSFHPD